ncbi:MAG: glucose-6-phosphate isomerase, partial [Betaproteobacteria bacterium]
MKLSDTPAWQALTRHAETQRHWTLRDLFATNNERFERFSIRHDGLLLDYSKQRVKAETMALLHQLAAATDVAGWRDRMAAGEAINHTENRAVLHMALRAAATDTLPTAGASVMPGVHAVLQRLAAFC